MMNCSICGLPTGNVMGSIMPQCKCGWQIPNYPVTSPTTDMKKFMAKMKVENEPCNEVMALGQLMQEWLQTFLSLLSCLPEAQLLPIRTSLVQW